MRELRACLEPSDGDGDRVAALLLALRVRHLLDPIPMTRPSPSPPQRGCAVPARR